MKTVDEIQVDIQGRFEKNTQKKIQTGSVIDFYNVAVSSALKGAYQEIEDSKNPHIFTGLTGEDLDNTGFWVNCPRAADESDASYIYRLMNWTVRNEASNTTAINDALLNLTYASNAEYIPLTKGSGTASVYIIPKTYDDATIAKALAEVKGIVAKVASPSLFIDYIIPSIRSVRFVLFIQSTKGDIDSIKSNIQSAIKTYVNSIAPGDFLEIGKINKIGVNEPGVDYFSVLSTYINEIETKDIDIIQQIETKLLFDKIMWEEN